MTQSKNNPVTLSTVFGDQLSKEDALSLLQQDPLTYQTFLSFPTTEQEDILSFIQGQQGLKITLDTFFNHVFSPIHHPDRLENFLSCLLNQEVHIKSILPREGNKIAESGSLVIMDIIVELADGSITDIEMQKIGYLFPGERSSCYVADFIMRQYNYIKSKKGKRFTYRDMKPVYLIVLMEKSSSEPKDILKLITKYPEFAEYYQNIVDFRKKPKELISMFSEALAMLDHNTELYMISELQNEVHEMENVLAEKINAIAELDNAIAEKDNTTAEKDAIIAALQEKLNKLSI